MVRVERIELSIHPWEGYVLPLNHTRSSIIYTFCDFWSRRPEYSFEPCRAMRLGLVIYFLIKKITLLKISGPVTCISGAEGGSWTRDLYFTKVLLYH